MYPEDQESNEFDPLKKEKGPEVRMNPASGQSILFNQYL